MEKLIYSMWAPAEAERDEFAGALRGEVAAAVLDAGARGLHIHVADGDVAGATGFATDEPITAFVSVWLDTVAGSERTSVEKALSAVAPRIAGYLVTESVPLAPPPTAGAVRTEGYAQMALLRRPSSLDREEWLERWQGGHTSPAIELQSIFGYVQNAVVRAVTPDAPPTDAIVEELFPAAALTSPYAFYDVPDGDKDALRERVRQMRESVARFGGEIGINVVPTSRYEILTPFAR